MLRKVYQRIARQKHEDKNTRDGWDDSYRAGYWDRLYAIDEVAHNAVVAGYCNALQSGASRILDVGCGEGLLIRYLNMSRVQRYLGVDISEVAIARAASISTDVIQFKPMNIEIDELNDSFSVIVVNECVYYFRNLSNTFAKMRAVLEENGYIVVSMYCNRQTGKLWPKIGTDMKMIDMAEIKNAKGTMWKIAVYHQT